MTSFVIAEQHHVAQLYWLPYRKLRRFAGPEHITSVEIAKLPAFTILNRRQIAFYLISFIAI